MKTPTPDPVSLPVQRNPAGADVKDTGRIVFHCHPPANGPGIRPSWLSDHLSIPFVWVSPLDANVLLSPAPITRDLHVQAFPVRESRTAATFHFIDDRATLCPNHLLCILQPPRIKPKTSSTTSSWYKHNGTDVDGQKPPITDPDPHTFVTATEYGENLEAYVPFSHAKALQVAEFFPAFRRRMLPYMGKSILATYDDTPVAIYEWVRKWPEDGHLLFPLYGYRVPISRRKDSWFMPSEPPVQYSLTHTDRSIRYRDIWNATVPHDRPALTPYKTRNAMQAFYWAFYRGRGKGHRNKGHLHPSGEVECMRQLILRFDPEWMDINRAVWKSHDVDAVLRRP